MIVSMYPYLVMNGNGREAVRFYENAFHAEVVSLQTFGNLPERPGQPMPAEAKNRVLNAHLKIGNLDLMLSDTFPGNPYEIGSQVTIAVLVNEKDKTREIFTKLEEGGKVVMPLQETFWSKLYGQVTDKFGVTWQISTEASNQ